MCAVWALAAGPVIVTSRRWLSPPLPSAATALFIKRNEKKLENNNNKSRKEDVVFEKGGAKQEVRIQKVQLTSRTH